MQLPHDTAVVVLSGGQDSTTCLFQARQVCTHVHAVTFDYGQRHRRELLAASRVARFANVDSHEVIVLPPGILHSTSPLVSNAPLEQYETPADLPGTGIEKTFVPMRNQLFLTLAANRAVELNARYLVTGVCQEDFGGYPDCRRSFIDLLQSTINESLDGTGHTIEVKTPLMYLSKAEAVRLACSMPDCWEALAFSHTSYDGSYPPTGHDHATLLRAKGFEEANVPDPLVLRAVSEHKMPVPATRNYSQNVVGPYMERLARAIQALESLRAEEVPNV